MSCLKWLDTLEANNQTNNNIQWSHQPLKLLMYMTWAWCSLQCVPPQLHLSTQSYLVKYNTMFLPRICRVLEAGFSNFMSTLINHAREGADSTKLCRDSQNADIPGFQTNHSFVRECFEQQLLQGCIKLVKRSNLIWKKKLAIVAQRAFEAKEKASNGQREVTSDICLHPSPIQSADCICKHSAATFWYRIAV